MKKLFFYAMLILIVVLTGCGKSEEQKIHSMYLNNSTKVAEMETEQAQAMLENRNIDKQKMLKQIKSLIEENEKNIGLIMSIIYIVGGAAAIVYGGDLVVDSASYIATAFGFSQTFIGLTVVAIGTSLPELVTSITAIRKGENDLALGNVLGSNLFNILFVLALSTSLTPTAVLNDNIIDLIFLVVASGIVYLFCLGKQKVSRLEGITMTGMYVFYTVYLLMR